jgi:MOSC domain-containing protein YiiM
MQQLTTGDLERGVDDVRGAPRDDGRVEMIVRRPAVDEREVLDEARLDVTLGLTGDTWRERGSSSTPDGTANPAAQVTVMSARAAALIAGDRERWPLAGDQLFVDLDLGGENLPPGTRLSLGDAVLEVSAKPHTGCKKFAERFGQDAARFVNSPVGRELSLRGINTRVVVPGTVRVGDTVRKASD